jgi:hypothetical protein
VPDHVEVRKVDLSIELQILAFHEQQKVTNGRVADAIAETVPQPLDELARVVGAE